MIAKFSVKKAYTIIVGIVLVLILGVVAYTKMTVDLLPSMELPYAIILTTYPGASPETVETGVTKPVEQSVATIDNVKEIQSMSADNYSMVIVEFNSDANMDAATIDMREKLDQITGYFDDSVGNPVIMKLNPNMMPVMVAAVDMKDASQIELSHYVEDTLSPEIEGVSGVASVTSMGIVEESVQVIIREDKVKAVNKQVKKALDDKFEEAQNALDDAQSQINSGKNRLNAGQKTAGAEFAKAEVEIDNQKLQLLDSEDKINSAYADLLEKETELNNAKASLESAISGLTQLKDGYDNAVAGKTNLENLMKTAGEQEQAAYAVQIAALESTIAQMEQQLAAMGLEDADGNAVTFATLGTYITSLNAQLTEVESGLTQIASGKTTLNETMNKISGGKSAIDEGKIALKTKQAETQSQMDEARIQLEQGESELESQKQNLEDAKDAAYEGADLNTIISTDLIKGMLTAQNFDFPAGYVTEDDVDYLVRVGNKFEDVEDLSDFVLLDLGMDGVDPIKLSDVADVFIEDNADSIYTKVNGKQIGRAHV